ncbi:MAG: LITAF-like zinc ribbon domain-containing protein [Aridibacter sp.]
MPQPLAYRQPQNMNYAYRCPRCAGQQTPRFERKISTAGWIIFAVLLVVFFPLFWIGLLIKEDVQFCSVCNLRLN